MKCVYLTEAVFMLNNKGTKLSNRIEQFFKQKTPKKFSNFGI